MIMGKGSPRFQQYVANLNRVRMNEFVDSIQRAQYARSGAGYGISGVSFAERHWPVPARTDAEPAVSNCGADADLSRSAFGKRVSR